MEHGSRTRMASLAILALVLVTGFLLGLAWERSDVLLGESPAADGTDDATRTVSSEDRRRGDRDGDGRDRGDDRDRDGRRERDGRRLIVDRVGINAVQKERADSIVEIHGDRIRELRREMEEKYDPRFRALRREMEAEYDPRFREVLLQTRSSIRALLSAEQARRYDSLLAEHDRREAREEERRRD